MRSLRYFLACILLVSCAARCDQEVGQETSAAAQKSAPRKAPEPIIGGVAKVSREACTSPCAVFFDAISDWSWEQIESSRFTWSFSDGTTAEGFMAARVFELSEGESKKIFEAKLVVERDGFLIARDARTVTVRPLRGRTICVAERDFSGCPTKARANHFRDPRAAWNAIETNGRILFRRGDSFSPGIRFGSTVPGPVHVGAFGDLGKARPSLTQSGGSWRLASAWSVTDLDISGAEISGTVVSIRGHHTLVMRSHIHDADAAFVSNGQGYDFSTHKFLVDNLATNIRGTNYIAGDRIAMMGNHMERWGEKHHTIRIGGGKHVLIANNVLISDVGHSSVTVRGSSSGNRPGSDYVLVQGNLLMQRATVHPQNDRSNEFLRRVIWERNAHVPNDNQPTIQNGLSANGHDMVIRNNVFHQVRRAINLETHPLVGASHNIHVYQNTHYVDRDPDSKNHFCNVSEGSSGVVIGSNLAVLHSRSDSAAFVVGDASVTGNYVYTPARTSLCRLPNGSRSCANPNLANVRDPRSQGFMLPPAGSLGIDAAAAELPMSYDFRGTPRPQGGSHDIGAVELPQ